MGESSASFLEQSMLNSECNQQIAGQRIHEGTAEPQWHHHLYQLFRQLGSGRATSAMPRHRPHNTASALADKSAAARKGLQRRGVPPTSTFRGVTVHKRAVGYCAQAWVDGKQVPLGRFVVEQQAAAAHDVVLLYTRGHSAQTNFASSTYATLLQSLQQVRSRHQHQHQQAFGQGGRWGALCTMLCHGLACLQERVGLWELVEGLRCVSRRGKHASVCLGDTSTDRAWEARTSKELRLQPAPAPAMPAPPPMLVQASQAPAAPAAPPALATTCPPLLPLLPSLPSLPLLPPWPPLDFPPVPETADDIWYTSAAEVQALLDELFAD